MCAPLFLKVNPSKRGLNSKQNKGHWVHTHISEPGHSHHWSDPFCRTCVPQNHRLLRCGFGNAKYLWATPFGRAMEIEGHFFLRGRVGREIWICWRWLLPFYKGESPSNHLFGRICLKLFLSINEVNGRKWCQEFGITMLSLKMNPGRFPRSTSNDNHSPVAGEQ